MIQHPSEKKFKTALKWAVNILKTHQIPFRVSGGLAAKAYGSKRKLFDIDLDIADSSFSILKNFVKKYISSGPTRFIDNHWNLLMMTIIYQGVSIDISGAKTGKLFDLTNKKWTLYRADFRKNIEKTIFGITVPVIPKNELIAYKQKLQRMADKQDIQAISCTEKN